ncbi:MAG: hypothetical protein GY777_23130 [Candidatus Brocadiaceae bacterium]|nr:hypothetical protein [Candidatus Brocadiaceae bacterium]
MPIIYTYPSATPTAADLLVFSDVSATDPAKDTRKCTIGDIVGLVGALVPGGGTVTSVDVSGGTSGLAFTGGAVTTTGTITLSSGQLVVANGGTGVATLTSNGVLVGNGVNPITSSSNLSFDDTDLTLAGSGKMEFRDANSYIHSNASNDLEIVATDITLNAATLIDLQSDAVSIGEGGDTDIVLTFNGNTSSGVLTWMEDEDHFLVGDDVVIAERLYIDDEGGEYISGDGTTATMTGAWASSNMTITGGSVTNITDLLVADGGTGVSTLTDGGILLGSGTGAVTVTSQPTNGQVLIGRTGNDPTLSTLTAGANISITNGSGVITIASTAGVPTKINYDNQLTFKGGTSGTYVPNVARLATYWTLGSFVYLEFYMEWNTAHGCVGTIIMDNLPKNIDPVGVTTEQGSCLITVNTNMGTSALNPAPLTGRPGVTGNNEIIFRNHTALGIIEDSIWTDINPEPVGNYVLAGTATWLEATA